MANYPQLDDQVGVWKLKDVNDALMGGYWRVHGSRGLCAGGNDGSGSDGQTAIDFVTLTTAGNATDFGDCTNGAERTGAISSNIRFICDTTSSPYVATEYVTIQTQGNAADFGDSTVARAFSGGNAGSQTRGIIGAGGNAPGLSDVIDYITIASAGNATDFGNLGAARSQFSGSGSPTRAVFFGGLE